MLGCDGSIQIPDLELGFEKLAKVHESGEDIRRLVSLLDLRISYHFPDRIQLLPCVHAYLFLGQEVLIFACLNYSLISFHPAASHIRVLMQQG